MRIMTLLREVQMRQFPDDRSVYLWSKRVIALTGAPRMMSPKAAMVVVDAAMFGEGCLEGTVRARIEREKIAMATTMRSIKWWCRCGGRGTWTEQIDGTKSRVVRCDDLNCIARRIHDTDTHATDTEENSGPV